MRARSRRGRPSAAICSLATGRHRELLAEAGATFAAYGRQHGWTTVLSSEELGGGRPAAWAKVPLIRELLDLHAFVLWLDADTIIVDLERDLLAEVLADDEHDVWLAYHPQQYDVAAAVPNTGVILARSSPFARQLLDAIWDAEQFIDHNWWENAALVHLLGHSLKPPYPVERRTPWQARVGRLDLAWNSVPGYCASERPAINHHARCDHDDFQRRLDAMASDRRRTAARFPRAFRPPGRWARLRSLAGSR